MPGVEALCDAPGLVGDRARLDGADIAPQAENERRGPALPAGF